jgi:glycine/D-amino acid oxidase-like deaminating enzyme
MRVAVVGTGIIGLMTARRLLDFGFDPILVSAAGVRGGASAAAAGIMLPTFPFSAGSVEFSRRIRWMDITLEFFKNYKAGRFFTYMDHVELFRDGLVEGQASMEVMLEKVGLSRDSLQHLTEPVQGFQHFARLTTPHFDTLGLLESLYEDLREKGVNHVLTQVDRQSLYDLDVDVLFNCLGMGARSVFNDETLIPVFGQAVRYPAIEQHFAIGMGDFFILSSPFTFYVGSPFAFGVDHASPQRDFHERLISYLSDLPDVAKRVGLDLGDLPLDDPLESVSGVRPFREGGARIESEQLGRLLVVHNYGHGAHGWAAAWGSAIDAVDLFVETVAK